MATINPYLIFDGNCAEVFDFYRSSFGGDFASRVQYKDAPSETPLSEDEGKLIIHVSLPLGHGTLLMGSDRPSSQGKGIVGNNFSISITTESEAEADKLFNGLSAGGKVGMPMQKTFWGAYFGMFTDRYGIAWMVNYDYPK